MDKLPVLCASRSVQWPGERARYRGDDLAIFHPANSYSSVETHRRHTKLGTQTQEGPTSDLAATPPPPPPHSLMLGHRASVSDNTFWSKISRLVYIVHITMTTYQKWIIWVVTIPRNGTSRYHVFSYNQAGRGKQSVAWRILRLEVGTVGTIAGINMHLIYFCHGVV